MSACMSVHNRKSPISAHRPEWTDTCMATQTHKTSVSSRDLLNQQKGLDPDKDRTEISIRLTGGTKKFFLFFFLNKKG